MSVLIRDIKMPETCEECAYQAKGACFASGVNKGTITIRKMDKDRPDWCPLAEIKSPHGRLIDADSMISQLMEIKSKTEKEPNNLNLYAVGFAVGMLSEQFVVVDKEGD